jgi:hypothetical protein
MLYNLRRKFFEIAIRILDSELRKEPRVHLQEEAETGLLAQMWENPAFRNYCADRNLKIVHILAGGEGLLPEPRDKYHLHMGQRVENLVLAMKCKAASKRVAEAKEQTRKASLAKEEK